MEVDLLGVHSQLRVNSFFVQAANFLNILFSNITRYYFTLFLHQVQILIA